jgi:hypothetical protein
MLDFIQNNVVHLIRDQPIGYMIIQCPAIHQTLVFRILEVDCSYLIASYAVFQKILPEHRKQCGLPAPPNTGNDFY